MAKIEFLMKENGQKFLLLENCQNRILDEEKLPK